MYQTVKNNVPKLKLSNDRFTTIKTKSRKRKDVLHLQLGKLTHEQKQQLCAHANHPNELNNVASGKIN